MEETAVEDARERVRDTEKCLCGAIRAAGPDGARLPGNDPQTAEARIAKARVRVEEARAALRRLMS